MSRNRVLLAVAAAALIAGTGSAFAQQEPSTGKEKSAPSTVSKPSPGAVQQNRSQQGSGQQGGKQQGVGQSEHSQTSGQAPTNAGKVGEKAGELKRGEKAIEKKAGQAAGEHQNTGQTERINRGDRERSTTGQAT